MVYWNRLYCECGKDTEYGIWIEKSGDREISINSCCGGGCNAANNIKYCPFCGKSLNLAKEVVD